nr:hypothetical protein [bacterium]
MVSQEIVQKYGVLGPLPAFAHKMVPQNGVRHVVLPPEVRHNAIWDYKISPTGEHYFSVCAEGNFSEFVRLYRYDPKTLAMQRLFKLEEAIITSPRAIRPSKVHTSMGFMPDGRLIMSTHTTASAPTHPYWMMYAYYPHLWEGYPGSNVLIYDPATGHVEDLGIPVPHETIYGGVYDAETNAFYFTGYMRGHMYKLDLANRHVTDYGQVTEHGSYCLVRGRDGNIYCSSRSGAFFRLNTRENRLEDLKLYFPVSPERQFMKNHHVILFAADGPDGKLYLAVGFSDQLMAYNYETGKPECVGRFGPEELFGAFAWSHDAIDGMAFDKDGVLWYGYRCHEGTIGESNNWLVSWDVLRGGKPQNHGLIGTPGRMVNVFNEMYIRDDVLYGSDTNHDFDPPGIFAIDLESVRNGELGPLCQDAYHWLGYREAGQYYQGDLAVDGERFYKTYQNRPVEGKFNEENHTQFKANCLACVPLWRLMDKLELSSVRALGFEEGGGLWAICGDGKQHVRVTIGPDGQFLGEQPVDWQPEDGQALAAQFADVVLPAQPGRRYLAQASAAAPLSGGRQLVGTKDGMAAVVSGKKAFSLGAAAPNGPVRAIASTPDGHKAFGVAGDDSDLGMVFSYDDENGLLQLGRVMAGARGGYVGCSYQPSCIAISPDGRRMAIGAADRLGCVYLFSLED